MPTSESPYERQEVDAAADEAGRIGGGDREQIRDPARQAVREAGGGEAEGFEETEEALIEHASHGDQQAAHAILHHQSQREESNLRREDAEADHERSSELDDDALGE